jgi:hypothetical protein
MVNRFFCIISAIFCSFNLLAQQQQHLGIRLGASLSNLSNYAAQINASFAQVDIGNNEILSIKSPFNGTYSTQPMIALQYEIPIYKNLSFQSELVYASTGSFFTAQYTQGVRSRIANVDLQLHYLQLPLLLNFRKQFENFSVYALGGTSFGLFMSGTSEFTLILADRVLKIEEQLSGKKGISIGELSWIFGIGMGLKAGRGEILIDLRRIESFTSAFNPRIVNIGNDLFNRAWQIGLGYRYPLQFKSSLSIPPQ